MVSSLAVAPERPHRTVRTVGFMSFLLYEFLHRCFHNYALLRRVLSLLVNRAWPRRRPANLVLAFSPSEFGFGEFSLCCVVWRCAVCCVLCAVCGVWSALFCVLCVALMCVERI